MAQVQNKQSSLYRTRHSFAKIPDVMEVPNLIAIQTESFEWFKSEGITAAFNDICPIESSNHEFSLEFGTHEFEEPKHSADECKEKDLTYQAALHAQVILKDRISGDVQEQTIYMGEFPMMTKRGTFIINGTERVVVSQLVRSPGVYFSTEPDKTSDKMLFGAKIIPSRGAWLEFETDKRDVLFVRIDRKRKQPATILLRALGIATTREDIIKLLGNSEMVLNTLSKDNTSDKDGALVELYKRFRPGEPATIETARNLLDGLFFTPQRYDLAKVGRYKINKKLGFADSVDDSTLNPDDIIDTMRYIIALHDGLEGYTVDDIDHFGNRRIKTVGELIQNQFRVGLSRMERTTRDKMSTQDQNTLTPQSLINIKPITGAIREFFGSSQLSQFMDQANPAAGITHKRRLSALGPGGLSRERAGFEVRDVHTSHYGRMCPIETPEGPNIGLIGSLATYGRINAYGFIETPYRRVVDGKVTDEVDYLTADEEENHTIAQANDLFDPETRVFGSRNANGEFVPATKILCRTKDANGEFGEAADVDPALVDYMDVSPRQMVSVATSLIPFLEHDDANRALMGSNMQRQAVPLLRPSAPLVGTGIEHRLAVDSGEMLIAQNAGIVDYVDGDNISILNEFGEYDEYTIPKFKRSNSSGCVNHKPIVRKGDKVYAGDVLADGPACDGGELALGQNLLVAYMPWEGYNYEDAIIVSERVVAEDLLTSITISDFDCDVRETKLGNEEITREIPNVSDEARVNLHDDGTIRVGAEVHPGDILVGKVSPKGQDDPTSEERLLRAIFGEKSRDVRDTSLKVPNGVSGRVIEVRRFSREMGDDLPNGVIERLRVFVAQKRKVQQGDKLSGRHGNKGVISRVLPVEDMPYMVDGTPVDVILNPLGVPSRMNVGQLLENHLGWAAKWGWDDEPNSDKVVEGPRYVATPVFDGATEDEISDAIEKANRNLININRAKYGDKAIDEMVPQLSRTGKAWLFDGRTGERFREPVTVGQTYILKLGHMVDDKIHARATGPYSLITQQPLGGKAQFGGQRFGEMEVWALYAYGAANVLQEILTVKSDDRSGRTKTYDAIVNGKNLPAAEVPESFKVLIKEMRSLCLNVQLEDRFHNDVTDGVVDTYTSNASRAKDEESDLVENMAQAAAKQDAEDNDLLGDLAASLEAVLGVSSDNAPATDEGKEL